MTLMVNTALTAAALVLLASPLPDGSGILIVEKTTTGTTAQTSQVQIEGSRMRVESAGAPGEKQTIIFDGTKQVMWIVNIDRKTYSEMTKADMDRIGGQAAGAMAQMQEQLKNMPPEQRAMVEKMMQGRGMTGMGAPPAPKTVYRPAGSDKVGKWTCTKYDGYQGSQKTAEVCTVAPDALGFTISDFDVSRQLGDFLGKLMPQNADRVFRVGRAEEQGFSGVPVRRVFSTGQSQTTVELTDVSRQSFPASTFEVPAGYKKEAIGEGQRR
jgi:hypothetical protein